MARENLTDVLSNGTQVPLIGTQAIKCPKCDNNTFYAIPVVGLIKENNQMMEAVVGKEFRCSATDCDGLHRMKRG